MILRFRDPRRFGAILWASGDAMHHPLLARLGPEPLTPAFNANLIYEKTRRRSASIKEVLMNSRIVVGIGNIYASEALFLAGINPLTAAGRIGMSRYAEISTGDKRNARSRD